MKNHFNKMISVIVPIFNAEIYIKTLILSLKNQSYTNFEVILVNNNSTDKTVQLISDLIFSDARFNLIHCSEKPSSYCARNKGVQSAKGDILAFTDSDCIPELDWLVNIKESMKERILLSGHVELELIDRTNIWEVFDKVAHMKNKEKSAKGHVATANMAVMKEDFYKVGFFSEVSSGGDYEWSCRALKSGLLLEFNEKVLVKHPTRKTKLEIEKKLLRIAEGQAQLSTKSTKAQFLYSLRVLNPLRTLKYTLDVALYTGVFKGGVFFIKFNILCFKQIKNFSKVLR